MFTGPREELDDAALLVLIAGGTAAHMPPSIGGTAVRC
jgi:hypothetical protein